MKSNIIYAKCKYIYYNVSFSLMHEAVGRLSVIFSLSLFACDFVDAGISFSEILIVS